jgi:hypothetical protein
VTSTAVEQEAQQASHQRCAGPEGEGAFGVEEAAYLTLDAPRNDGHGKDLPGLHQTPDEPLAAGAV